MDDAKFEQLKTDLEKTYDQHEQLQTLYKAETGRRWMAPLKITKSSCPFCGEKYFHKSNCK